MPIDPSKIPPWMQQLNGMQLSPEQLAQLNSQFAGTYGTLNRDGFDFAPAVEYGQGENNAGNNTIHGYSAIPQGTTWDLKDGEDFYGGFDKSGKFEGARQPHAFDMGDAAPFLMAIAAGAAAMAPAGAAAGAGGAAGGTSTAVGPGMAGWGADLGVSSGLSGGAMGSGAMGTMAPLELMATPSWIAEVGAMTPFEMGTAGGAMGGAAGAGAAGGGGGGGGAGAWTTAAADSQAANAALGLGPVSGATAPAIPVNGGSAWGMKDLLGIGTSLLGAASGAEGQKGESSQTRDIPSWLKPYVQKNLGYASGLLDKQMAPGAMPGYEAMRNVGMGLLGTPQQGNGFNRFFPGR